jgi:diguanylate cyclase (GGDEF)-like protein
LGIALFLGLSVGLAVSVVRGQQTSDRLVSELEQDTRQALFTVDLLLNRLLLTTENVRLRLDPDDPAGSLGEVYSELAQDLLDFRTILVIDQSGIVVADPRPGADALGLDVSDRSYFQNAMDAGRKPFILGDEIMARDNSGWALPLSIPLISDEGRKTGVLASFVGTQFFNTLDWPELGADTQIYLAGASSGSFVTLGNDFVDDGRLDAIQESVKDTMEEQTGRRVLQLAVPEQVAFLGIGSSGRFMVVAERSQASIFAAAQQSAMTMGVAVGLVVTFFVFGALRAVETIRQIRREAEHLRFLEQRHRIGAEAAGLGVWEVDLRSHELKWDAIQHQIMGSDPKTFSGTFDDWPKTVIPEDAERTNAEFVAFLEHGGRFNPVFDVIKPNGERRTIRGHAAIMRGQDGEPQRVLGVNFDITEQVERERALEAAREKTLADSFTDPLTKAGSYAGLVHHLDTLNHKGSPDTSIAILQVDIDNFKSVNSLFGRNIGDNVLRRVALTLKTAINGTSYVARIGEDQFVVLISGPRADDELENITENILDACRAADDFEHDAIRITVSIGLAVGPLKNAEMTIEDAEIALSRAKSQGGNRMVAFEPLFRLEVEDKKRLSDDLLDALKKEEFRIRLQPQVSARTKELDGVEALVRWHHKERGELAPNQFLPLAAELGLMAQLDAFVFKAAASAVMQLRDEGVRIPSLSVNVSPERLMAPSLLEDIDTLGEFCCPLVLELLETIDFDVVDENYLKRVADLRSRGVKIAIDDFGSGHASITTLLALEPDRIKIDRRLVMSGVNAQGEPSALLVAVADMCNKLGVPMTAEGIETQKLADSLTALGCDQLQGYLYHRPLSIDEFREQFADA